MDLSSNGDYQYYMRFFERIKERDEACFMFVELVNVSLTRGRWEDAERLELLNAINQAFRDTFK